MMELIDNISCLPGGDPKQAIRPGERLKMRASCVNRPETAKKSGD